jgi:hypothetical protein
MVKSNFFKTMKNNMSFSKPFIILGLVIILSIVLFSSVNECSLENFTPKPNAKLEIMLWTDASGSLDNPFLQKEWLDLITKYEKYATFAYGGGARDYITYVNGLTTVKGVKIDKRPKDEDFKGIETVLPFVTVVIEIDKVKDLISVFNSGFLTTEAIKTSLFSTINKHYRKLYTNATTASGASEARAPRM